MTAVATPPHALVLAVHPFARGMGWVAFEAPFAPYDWGFVYPRRDQNLHCVRKLERLLKLLQPDTLIIEINPKRGGAYTPRIARLHKSFIALAVDRGITVSMYSRQDVKACFASVGAVTRLEIAEAVARHIGMFEHLLPPLRRKFGEQHRYMALFNAAALAITHYQRQKLRSPEEFLSE